MEIINNLLSENPDYLNALRFAQQLPPPPSPPKPPDTNKSFIDFNSPFFWILTIAGFIAVGYILRNTIEAQKEKKKSSNS